MTVKKTLIIHDLDNQNYWKALTEGLQKKINPLNIMLAKQWFEHQSHDQYNLFVIDISDLDDLYAMITAIHLEQPESRIIILSSTPTWKLTREVIRLGASTLIRKSSNMAEVIDEL